VDMDGVTALSYGNNRFQRNQYVLGNANARYFMWFGERTLAEWQSYGNDVGQSVSGGDPGGQRIRYLGDENWIWMLNGWGAAEKNRSNGEAGNDGRTISIDGVTYAKGLGVHAYSDLRWNFFGECTTFSAVIGIDDEVGARGSASFEVYVDGALRYNSGTMTSATPAKSVLVDLTGGNQLALIVKNGGDDYSFDHADWADAKVTCR